MIKKISFKNYKLFRNRQELELRPMTILIGKNSSGKSAVTKLLTLIENSLNGELDTPLALENEGIELGAEFRDLIFGRHNIGVLEIGLENDEHKFEVQIASGTRISDIPKVIYWKLDDNFNFKYNDKGKNYIDANGKYHKFGFRGFRIKTLSKSNTINNISPNLSPRGIALTTNYIGPYRTIPSRILKSSLQSIKNGKLGIKGERTYPFLIRDALYNHQKTLTKISEWYENNFDGWGLKVNIENAPNYELELKKDNPKMEINFCDVGEGMIQALPLILSSYLPPHNKDVINVFEQPELHLHPAAHGDLAERFANSTLHTKKRYLIETHSQNFVLRLRRLVAEKKLNKDDLVIYYIDYDQQQGESNLKRINVDEKGKVDYWPTNIFSETLEETIAIRTAQLQNPSHAY